MKLEVDVQYGISPEYSNRHYKTMIITEQDLLDLVQKKLTSEMSGSPIAKTVDVIKIEMNK